VPIGGAKSERALLITALKNAILKNQDNQKDKKKVIKTLIDEFDYPKFGPGMMWQAMVENIREKGSHVCLGKRWKEFGGQEIK